MSSASAPRRDLTGGSKEKPGHSSSERPAAASTDSESQSFTRVSSTEARHALIAEAAYRHAERRGFLPGEDLQDWFAAEREVDALLDPDL